MAFGWTYPAAVCQIARLFTSVRDLGFHVRGVSQSGVVLVCSLSFWPVPSVNKGKILHWILAEGGGHTAGGALQIQVPTLRERSPCGGFASMAIMQTISMNNMSFLHPNSFYLFTTEIPTTQVSNFYKLTCVGLRVC